ncbi:hypothetical protein J6590_096378 [Homalodisca vitripennis]|nr:hypothetical protein J6590_096378 [Homalodisca vitripennis]
MYKYSELRFRKEEKFSVLPARVKARVEGVLLNWLFQKPRTRLCLANTLGMSLTILAHATHHIYMDWCRFMDAELDDAVLLRIIRCFNTSVPEPGTYVGEIVAQFFQHFRQQSNLNVKRKIGPDEKQTTASQPAETTNTGDTPTKDGAGEKALNHQRGYTGRQRSRSDDRKFETIMSLNRLPRVSIMFRMTQRSALSSRVTESVGSSSARAEPVLLVEYLKKRVFGSLCYGDGSSYLSRVEHEFTVHQYADSPDKELYFTLDITNHRLGECNGVFCSDTMYFMGLSKHLFVDNSVTYMYCFLTDKYKPVVESKEDTDAFGLAKILSSVEFSTKCSLKRNHNRRMGHGPLTSVISEGGLNESAKFVNNLLRKDILCPAANQYPEPQSPTYSPTGSGSVGEYILQHSPHTGSGDRSKRTYVINEPYVNTFLNRPVECGNMY